MSLSRYDLSRAGVVEDLAGALRREIKCRCLVHEALAKHTSLRVGGPASLYVYPADAAALSDLLSFCGERRLATYIIGYGTNLLVSDEGFAGCVIDLADGFRTMSIEGGRVTAGAAVWGTDVVQSAAEAGLGGMEKLAGIPGGIGGWVWMNGGAFGASISDHLVDLEVMERDGRLVELRKEEVGFVYRAAPGLAGRTILAARFDLPSERRESAISAVQETIAERYRRNVMTLPSAGSVFKNPPGHFAAKLIESIGGKGMSEGGVEISPLHANFIVNARGGTAGDILRLIRRVRGIVAERYGVHLELEVRTLGFEESLEDR